MGMGIKNGEIYKMNKFLTEILQQPKALNDTLEYYSGDEGLKKLKNISDLFQKGNFQKIIFTGMGSSYFSSYAASCLFNSLGINSFAVNTSELLYYNLSLITENTLLVCVSQSGESIEVVKIFDALPANITCIGVSNDEKSSLAKKAKEVLLSRAGKEDMTSTKTFTSITLLMFVLGWYIANKWDKEKIAQTQKLAADFGPLVESCIQAASERLDFFGEVDFMQFIGRGPSFASVRQSELMFKEATQIPSAGTLGGEFRHGPMEMVKPGFKSVLFASEGKTFNQSVKMAADIVKYHGKVLVITNKAFQIDDKNAKIITINQPDEFLFAVQNIVPVQLMVNSLGLAKGLEPGNFINGGKVTLME
jgi:glutamine---fructose-6-phosphate transaminase (isomerizing)